MLGSSVRALVVHVTIQKGTKWACVCAKKGSRAFRPCVHLSRMFRHLDIVRGALVTIL